MEDKRNICLSIHCAKCGSVRRIEIDEVKDLSEQKCNNCNRKTVWRLDEIEGDLKSLGEKVEVVKNLSRYWKEEEIKKAWLNSFDDGEAKFKLIYYKAAGIGEPLYRERIKINQEMIVTNDGIWKIIEKQGDVKDKIEIVRGHFVPTKKIELEGETLFEVEMNKKIVGNAKEIYRMLELGGNIVYKSDAQNYVNRALLGMVKETIKAHSTFDVYDENDGLELCLNPIPRTECQRQVFDEIKKSRALEEEITKEKLENWLQILQFWEKYEILPTMGLSVMSAFAFILGKHGFLFPNIFHYSPESGLGKTEVAKIYTAQLFGKKIWSADSVNSKYRLADAIDCYGGLIAVNEAEEFSWKKHVIHLMHATETEIQDRRGTPNLGSKQYLSRAAFVFTGNKFPLKGKPKLVRFLKIEFDANKKLERSRKESRIQLYNAIKKLKPIGWRLVELELERIRYTTNNLISNIHFHAGKIEDIFGVFEDGRRATVWGIVYEGLKVWGYAFKKYGVEWNIPSYEEFVANIVRKIEADTFESKELPAEDFIAWWEGWKARNVIKAYDTDEYLIKGKEKIWDEKTIEVDGEKIDGDVITNSILREYKRDKGDIETLSDLAKGISLRYGLPYTSLYKVWKIGRKSVKGVFIPNRGRG